MIEPLLARFAFEPTVVAAARRAEPQLAGRSQRAVRDEVAARVLAAFARAGIAESDLHGTLGYGYDDPARAHYEAILAELFCAERAFVRLSLVSGTHALVTALDALLAPGMRLLCASGPPYDTLRRAICGERGLVSRGIVYQELALAGDGTVDERELERASRGAGVVFVQRSRGYAQRPSLSAALCGRVAALVHRVAPAAAVVVDDCYCELVEAEEPTALGADLAIGSLLKNLGGGLAPGGAYVAGRAALVERVAERHYAPGLGAGIGPNLGWGRTLLQGLFLAPLVVGEALAGLDFAAALFAELGFAVDPLPGAERCDVVQAIGLGSPERVLAFARGLQRALPVNNRFAPEAGAVPGYGDPVVMSSGAFVAGATIELSCDAPLRAPYEVYLQGGIERRQVALGALCAADALVRQT
ncbi:MAG: methionine gamma-lyase family protein [Vulcanimicrobiaceae bacterium]